MKFRPLFLALAGIATLSFQIAGLHLHGGEPSGDVHAHGRHLHDIDTNGQDHSTAVDLTLFDLGIVWTKLVAVLVAVFSTSLAIVWTLHTLLPPHVCILSIRGRSHWRPPPRAPPLFS